MQSSRTSTAHLSVRDRAWRYWRRRRRRGGIVWDVVTRGGDTASRICKALKDGPRLLDSTVCSIPLDQQVCNVRRHVYARFLQPSEILLCEIHPLARHEHVDQRLVGDGIGKGSRTTLGRWVRRDGLKDTDGLVSVLHDTAISVDECRPVGALRTDARVRLDTLKGCLHGSHINGFNGSVCINEELRHMSDRVSGEKDGQLTLYVCAEGWTPTSVILLR